ncbi:hypothetical protein GCM10010329_04020 [Streptomyces spiroverticillatus]|nr:hypothetical protein [Streptomyces finlayi]GGZ87283.1 hypothetical protein GCM10010329_04020 [Streptomyces spiroverticillatus]
MGAVARRPTAAVTGLVLILEAFGFVFVNYVLGRVVEGQSMSLAGLDPGAMAAGAWIMGGVAGVFLAVCGVFLVLAAVKDRPALARWLRILLIVCAVVHGVLGAAAVGLVSWWAFAWMMLVVGLIVLSLLLYGRRSDALHDPQVDAPPAKPTTPPTTPPGNGSAATA